jgi:hypothetical protein
VSRPRKGSGELKILLRLEWRTINIQTQFRQQLLYRQIFGKQPFSGAYIPGEFPLSVCILTVRSARLIGVFTIIN